MNLFDVNIEHLQSQLQQSIDLHINKCIPIMILLLTNVFYLSKIRLNKTIAEEDLEVLVFI